MLMTKTQTSGLSRQSRGRWLLLLFFLLLLYVVAPRIGNFSDSLKSIQDSRLEYVVLALASVVATFFLAAGIYQCLAVKRLYFRRTLTMQIANAFANRLLPAGVGGMTLSMQYLRRAGHTIPQALAMVGINNLLGVIGHLSILMVAMLVTGGGILDEIEMPDIPDAAPIAAAVLAVIFACLLVLKRVRLYLRKFIVDISAQIVTYRRHPLRLAAALMLSVGLTMAYAMAFYFCGLAVGANLGLGGMFVAFTFGLIVTTATPTPGGLGGAEAGLVAAMVIYGVDASTALACALLYRFITYWLPLLPGFAVFVAARKRFL